jgi:hypothetical protein
MMPVESASSVRAAAAEHSEAARQIAHAQAVAIADSRRSQRVEEAKAAVAARPRPQDRAADAPPPRERSSGLLLDVLA